MPSISALFESRDIHWKTQDHLQKVYFNIAMCVGVCAVGAYLNATYELSGWICMTLSIIGQIFVGIKIMDYTKNDGERMGWMWGLSFFAGFQAGPLLHYVNMYHPEILYQALACTAVIFGSFSVIALFSQRRSFLFLGGIINAVCSVMFWYCMINWIFKRDTT